MVVPDLRGSSHRVQIAGGRFGVQQEVASYTTVDLFLSYELPETVLSGTVPTLNVDNLLDKDPPFYNGCVGGAGVCGSPTVRHWAA